jgi:hypothetical protein
MGALWQYVAEFLLEWEMFQTEVVEKIKIHFMFNHFFLKIVQFIRQCVKIWQNHTSHKSPYNTAHALSMLDN